MHRVDAVKNSSRVHQKLAKGIQSSLGWRKGVCQKKIETRRKIVGSSRKAFREKLTGNMKRDHREKTGGLTARMSEVADLCES
ncbi:hypothetical protein GW17_00057941 [Ensete ventricosum]|nr:hypothetical protein GW17_00057941 [Ensete ventricosum]